MVIKSSSLMVNPIAGLYLITHSVSHRAYYGRRVNLHCAQRSSGTVNKTLPNPVDISSLVLCTQQNYYICDPIQQKVHDVYF